MAGNLLDIIRQNRAGLAGTQATLTDETQRAQGLLRAKSGKALGSSDIGTSNLGEQAAVAGTQAQLGAMALDTQVHQTADDIVARKEELQTQQQRQQIEQARKFQTAENRIRTTQLLNDLSRDKASLDLDKDRGRLEQTAFLLSIQDKQYVDQLQDVGKRQRLDNEVNFREAQEQMAFGDSLSLLRSKLQGKSVLQVSDREFQQALSQMSIDELVQMAELEARDMGSKEATDRDLMQTDAGQKMLSGNVQAQAQGIQGLLQGGLQGYSAYANSTKKETT